MKVVCIDKRYSIGGMSFHVSEINIGQTYDLYKDDTTGFDFISEYNSFSSGRGTD